MRGKIAVALGFVVLALIVWIATRKKPAPPVTTPAIISSLVTASASVSAAPIDAGPTYAGGFCDAMERESHIAITKGSKLAGQVLEDVLPKPPCVDGARGGWALRVDDAIGASNDVTPGTIDIGFEVALVHRDSSGALTRYPLPHDAWHPDGGIAMDVAITRMLYWGARSIDKLVVGDIDGDGDPEAFVSGSVHEEGPDEPWNLLVGFHDGAIRPYAGAKDIDVVGAADVDGDGLLDLLTPGAYAGINAESAIGSSYAAVGGVFVAHALPDGGFSENDGVAKKRLLETCPKKQKVVLSADWVEAEDGAKQVLCARAWGVREATIVADMKVRCVAFDDDYRDMTHCPKALLVAAKVTPVVTLP